VVEPLIHFTELEKAGYGQSGRAVRALCQRYEVPFVQLNKRQNALTPASYALLMAKMSGAANES
jgi:hypothetical protein